MTHEGYIKATPFIKELETMKAILKSCKSKTIAITVEGINMNSFSSPTSNKKLQEAVLEELQERIQSLESQISKIN